MIEASEVVSLVVCLHQQRHRGILVPSAQLNRARYRGFTGWTLRNTLVWSNALNSQMGPFEGFNRFPRRRSDRSRADDAGSRRVGP